MEPLFAPGMLTFSSGAREALIRNGNNLWEFLDRHTRGDWGEDANEDDRRVNDLAVQHGGRILSAYRLRDGEVLWLHTDTLRYSTLFLLAAEEEES